MTAARTSLRLSLASLRHRRRRYAGTFLAVLLGVAFLGGTLVMGDTLRQSFDSLFGRATAGTDAVVRSAEAITVPGDQQGTREPVRTALAERIEAVPGVAEAVPDIQGPGRLLGEDGEPVGGGGPPTRAGNWITDPGLNPYALAEGRAPQRAGEAVVNRGAAKAGGLEIGDTTVLRTPDPLRVTVVGIATFGGEDGMGQVTFTGLTRADAEKHLTAEPGSAASIQVRATPGTGQDELVAALAPVLPAGVEAVTGQDYAEENLETISGRFLSGFTTGLLGFAGVALLVAAFSIHSTFAIVVAQRTRENALLRALGATRRQILRQTVTEALAVGTVASLTGLGGGIAVAAGLQRLFPAVGFPFPEGDLAIGPVSLLLPLAAGILVCLGSAVLPAVRAGRTVPLAVLRESAAEDPGVSRARTGAGALLGVFGAALTVWGASTGPSLALAAAGAALTLGAFVALGPAAASAAIRVLGAPLRRLGGTGGDLARRNALRNPRRTAATATALMTGVAVVSLFTVFGASLKASLHETVAQSFAGDLAVRAPAFGTASGAVSPGLAPALERLPEVDGALGLGRGVAEADGGGRQLTVTDPAALAGALDLGRTEGSLAAVGPDGLAVSADEAAARGWQVGSTLNLRFTDGTTERFTVRAVYAEDGLAGDYLLDRQAWSPQATQQADSLVVVTLADGVSPSAGEAAVGRIAEEFGSPEVQTREEFAASSAEGVDMMLTLVYALLGLAVLIALLGIANTLTLAVHERSRELGLLRAVGQTRAQLRAMVRWESVLVAAFGTAGGLALGGFLGWALVRASDSGGTGAFAVPPAQFAIVAVAGAAAGVAAAWRPARRAARQDVLRAVAAD